MPIVSPFRVDPLVDGRQSERAMMVRRGVQRLMLARKVSLLPEMALASGRRADLVCLSEKGEITIIEIKTSIEDFRVDRKWPDYLQHCDRLFFATHPGVPAHIFPESCGLIVSDGYGAEILREAPEDRIAPATRKAMTLRFARLAADRLVQAEWAANPFMTGMAGETEAD
ncbi:MmcB family DNA repair protein [Aurantimonas coralicida]|uniref:MmcB family DNA repair protein n=1 Tax=Aurantimonas coralicida TaxID=182270 RepID=UPI00041F3940|nr:MmcB family DNA repair protein [Aurantimonas coralicida]